MDPQPIIHKDDADEDDENVKQLQQCSSLYILLQDCLVNSNRNWKVCQKECSNCFTLCIYLQKFKISKLAMREDKISKLAQMVEVRSINANGQQIICIKP
uniref:Uncharacterized protein n=1 Tax=Lactuca sativa TaxID=4236 RepID=A0A9R1USM1_LACSA|nr:hypothetical protein LSAT_V11C800452450 [Lactuca sativa]